MGMIKTIWKRITKAPMDIDDLMAMGGATLIANPPETLGWAQDMSEQKFSDGRTLLDGWRGEMKTALAAVAAEPAWRLQKLKLLNFCLNSARWSGVYNAVGEKYKNTDLWHEWVEHLSSFKDMDRDGWHWRLTLHHMNASFSGAVLTVVGRACYGISEKTERLIDVYRKLEQESHEKNLVMNAGLRELANESERNRQIVLGHLPRLKESLRQSNEMMRGLAESIATERVSQKALGDRWAEMADAQNAVLLAIRDDIVAALDGDLRAIAE
jgi:hypothetical protein